MVYSGPKLLIYLIKTPLICALPGVCYGLLFPKVMHVRNLGWGKHTNKTFQVFFELPRALAGIDCKIGLGIDQELASDQKHHRDFQHHFIIKSSSIAGWGMV